MNKKHLFALIAAFIALALQACQPQASDTTNKSGNQATTTNNAHFQGPVEWISIEQLEQKMKSFLHDGQYVYCNVVEIQSQILSKAIMIFKEEEGYIIIVRK